MAYSAEYSIPDDALDGGLIHFRLLAKYIVAFCDFKIFRLLGQLTVESNILAGQCLSPDRRPLFLLRLSAPLEERAGLQP